MRPVTKAVVVCALVLCSLPAALASKASELRTMVLTNAIPPITDEQKKLEKVDFAPDAPAVVLLNHRQDEWEKRGSQWTHHVEFLRRIKILKESGVEKHGDYTIVYYSALRPEKLEARTVLPDGTVIKADDQFKVTANDLGRQIMTVAFPKVQVGAILDLHFTMNADSDFESIDPFHIQNELPVVEARYVLTPPAGLFWEPAFQFMPQSPPERVKLADGREFFLWRFSNVEPLLEEPNTPPFASIAKTLYIRPLRYVGSMYTFEIAPDWAGFSGQWAKWIEEWLKIDHKQTDALVAAAVAEKTDPLAKAEAIRALMKQKVKHGGSRYWDSNKSLDAMLASGRASSWQIAIMSYAMLKQAGVNADLMMTRRRDEGTLPPPFPLPVLMTDLLLRINAPAGPQYWSPVEDLPVGTLPAYLRGVLAMPIGKDFKEPVTIPAITAKENTITREVTGKFDLTGRIEAQTVARYTAAASASWRDRLQDAEDTARREMLQKVIRRTLPTAQVNDVKVENLDDPTKELVITYQWTADNAATVAGNRLLFKGVLYGRIAPSDWPAGARKQFIDLDECYQTNDKLELALPDGIKEVTKPDAVKIDAPGLGYFDAYNYSFPKKIVIKRTLRIDNTTFTAASYPSIRDWFSRIAAFDDAPTVLRVPE